jgi:hypothetical protein
MLFGRFVVIVVVDIEMLAKEDPCRAKLHFPVGEIRDFPRPLYIPRHLAHLPLTLRETAPYLYTSDTTIPWHVTGKHAPSRRRAALA